MDRGVRAKAVSLRTKDQTAAIARYCAQAGTPLATIARELGNDLGTTYKSYIGYSRAGGHESAID